jgi:serine O-acetyltransferase
MTLRETFRLIRSDIVRMSELQHIPLFPFGLLFIALYPSIVALSLHRITHWLYANRARYLAWPLYLFNYYLTGADLAPSAQIGRCCNIGHVSGTVITGRIGENVSLFGAPDIGGGNGTKDVGAGPGLPVIGDNVIIGTRAVILGGIRVGDNCLIGACALVLTDVPAGKVVLSVPGRVICDRAVGADYADYQPARTRANA